jgi:membrane-bound metal-dependent hydrolase YbcI (DUF457 family)
MPFTPFHLGPALFFGLLLFAFIDFPTFLVANVIVDLEPFLVVFLGLDYPLHGFFHSFIGGTLVAVVLAFVMFKLSYITLTLMKFFRLEHKASWKQIMAASLLGVYSHILLDAPLYPDIRPFYPFDVNPFFSNDMAISIYIYMFCIFSLLAGTMIYIIRLAVQARKKSKS